MVHASLPMYDLPEIASATDAWWAGLASALRREGIADVPAALTRADEEQELWGAPGLLLSQTCGYPLMNAWHGRLQPIATPCYDAEGCDGPTYCSLVVVREGSPAATLEDLRSAVCAINSRHSQSGYSALRALVAPLSREGRFFGRIEETGAHVRSLAAVASGKAEVAAIDCVTHALLARHRPAALEGTRVLCRTASAPGLPYVSGPSTTEEELARLRAGLFAALADPRLAEPREALLIRGAEVLPLAAYGRIRALEEEARAAGYPVLV